MSEHEKPAPMLSTEALSLRLERIEQLLQARKVQPPAWRAVTVGEQRWAVSLTILTAVGLQLALPPRLTIHPHWMLPALELALLVALVILNPTRRIDQTSRVVRYLSLALVAALSLANGWSAVRLVNDLIHRTGVSGATDLLRTGGAVWATNVIAFALWYWEWDRGGPAARAQGVKSFPDFLFPQMQQPGIAPPDWEPAFPDYLYTAFTNATAFSPTDTMPLSVWAKLLMMAQSAISLLTVVLVVARAVNILQ